MTRPRCRQCGARVHQSTGHRCPEHRDANILHLLRLEELALQYAHRAKASGTNMTAWADTFQGGYYPGLTVANAALAATWLADWGWLPELGEPRKEAATPVGLFS